jgi:hypothetical protein
MDSDDDNEDDSSSEQIDVTKFKEEVENPTKERTVNLIIIKPIEKKSTQQAIELQDVVVYNGVEVNKLERTVEKVDNISEVQVTEYKNDTAEGHVSVEEVTGVQSVTVTFQKLIMAALYELQDGKGKYRSLFNPEHQKLYFEIRREERGRLDVLESSTTTQAEKRSRRQQKSKVY